MDITTLKEKLNSIATMEEIGLSVYFLLKDGVGGNLIKRADIVEEVKEEMIVEYQRQLENIVTNEDLALISLSAADDRSKVIYKYDLEEKPALFGFFDEILNSTLEAEPEYFSFSSDSLTDLEGYFVWIGDQENNLLIFRKQMPINLFKRGKIYLIKGHETQFEKIEEEFLRIDTKIDIFNFDEETFINNIDILEKHYEFNDIIITEARNSLLSIESIDILENIEVLEERITDLAFARKLSKISTSSPVFSLPTNHIMSFVQNHRILGAEFKYNSDGTKILLDTKKSQNFFLKLMNDDFLHSELTDFDYITPAKDRLESEN
jgi:Domain of unknown function (DUF4868)